MSSAVSRLSSTGFESAQPNVRTDPVEVDLSHQLPRKYVSGARLTELRALGWRGLTMFGVACGIVLAAGPAAAGQISCAKSGVDFNRTVFPAPFDFVCKKEEMPGEAAASGDQAVVDRAFAPADSEINGVLMSSRDGKYGNAFLITAHDGAKLGEPGLRSAIEAKVRLFGDKAGSVAWADQRQIGDYGVDFFRLTLPQSGSGGGARECMGFVRYVDGNAAGHARRVIGSYCEIGGGAFDNDKATRVLNAVIVRLGPQ
jgi:hypothetical protein